MHKMRTQNVTRGKDIHQWGTQTNNLLLNARHCEDECAVRRFRSLLYCQMATFAVIFNFHVE